MLSLIFLLSLFATLPFFYIAYFVFKKGFSAISWDFFTKLPAAPGVGGGGLANGILGSAVMVGMACLVGLPWGCFLGIFLSEYRSHPLSKLLRFVIDLFISTPSIVIGIFVYSLLVSFFGFSAYAGSLALLLILVPIIGKSTEEILKMVPNHIREAGLALGLPRWKVILQILIPGTFTMLFSGVILSIARIAGETAPLLFTSLGNQFFSKSLTEPTASLPVQIYELSKNSGFPDLEAMAWGGAFVLISFVFFINFSTRFMIFIRRPNKTGI
ncbi:MAG: phosphate ABC transporter permease PstA [Oligoflexia bacterium]|nr:phosphate ABC transporter permease PstA [Oligoflexia bacterium]